MWFMLNICFPLGVWNFGTCGCLCDQPPVKTLGAESLVSMSLLVAWAFPVWLYWERTLGNLSLVSFRHHLLHLFLWYDYALSPMSPSRQSVNLGVVSLGNPYHRCLVPQIFRFVRKREILNRSTRDGYLYFKLLFYGGWSYNNNNGWQPQFT